MNSSSQRPKYKIGQTVHQPYYTPWTGGGIITYKIYAILKETTKKKATIYYRYGKNFDEVFSQDELLFVDKTKAEQCLEKLRRKHGHEEK